MSKTLRRILAVPSGHALRNDSKRHVTPISANQFSFSFETVANAPQLLCAIYYYYYYYYYHYYYYYLVISQGIFFTNRWRIRNIRENHS